jgi:hypothetical protein|tara:strand:- start:3327 stop:3542 length:216 start_codon:yes stop_codon:yes gene_type:complete
MKTNFKKSDSDEQKSYAGYDEVKNSSSAVGTREEELTQEEFEDFIVNSGAKGSFMIYRSEKKDQELGIDEL